MTPPVPRAQRGVLRLLRLSPSNGVWILNICMAAGALLLHAGVVVDLERASVSIEVPWWALAPLFTAAEIFVVHLHLRRDAHSFSLSEVPLVLGLFFVAPSELLLSQLVGAGAALLLHRKQSIIKMAFNLCRWSLETTVALMIFHAIADRGDPLGPVGWIATFAAVFVVDLMAGAMIGLVISLSERKAPELPRVLAVGNAATFTNTTLALAAVAIVDARPSAAWMVAVLAAGLLLAYRAHASITQRHEALQLLHESTRMNKAAIDPESAVLPLLAQARDMLRAEIAEATLFPTEGKASLRTTVGPGEHVEAMVPVALDPTEGVWARVAAEGQPVLLSRPIRSEQLRSHFESKRIKDAIVAPVRSDSGIVGTIMVANRLGDVSTFDGDDLKLFETLVNHASVSLENFRLVDTLRRQAAESEHQALHDALTGLPNRVLFNDRVRQSILTAERESTQVAVMIMDLDRFKEVNDTLGHHNGDLLLEEVGRRLRETVRVSDTVARLGGDEFAVLLPRIGGLENATLVADNILESLKRSFLLEDIALDVGASVGIALFPEHGMDGDTLVQRADVAMYLAKGAHSGYEVYQHERNQYSPRRLALVAELRGAIEDGQLTVLYQPKAELARGRVVGVEALVRWDHPREGLLSPDKFVPIAENTGLIKPLTLAVLDQALAQCRAWTHAGTPLTVAVNLSARVLLDLRLPNEIEKLLARWSVDSTALELEITESSLMADPVRTREILSKLSARGVGIAIDDFGTGYSSLSHLSALPVDEIKIDRSFVLGMAEDDNADVIVRSIIDLGRNLDLRVVAEGVESRATWDRLALLGCDEVQGFYLGRPMSAHSFDDWLAASSHLFATAKTALTS